MRIRALARRSRPKPRARTRGSTGSPRSAMNESLRRWPSLVGREAPPPFNVRFRENTPDAANTMNAWPEICGPERSALLAEALRLGGRLRLQVHGESMLPALWPGDIVEIEPCRMGELRRDDIVLATRNGRLFLHRFLRHCPAGGFILCGDSMPKPDPAFASSALVARMVFRTPGRRIIGALPPRWSRAFGFVLCYCGIARRLALRWHRRGSAPAEHIGTLTPASRGNL